MKEKLTLEHIAPYLPYGLKIIHNADCVIREISSLNTHSIEVQPHKHGFKYMSIEPWYKENDSFKPILREMELTKPITIGGKEVIPILELAKMRFHNYEWQPSKHKYVVCGEGAFEYSEKGFYYWGTDGEVGHIPNQIGLFKWLYANKFDVEGLIDAGLAIDVNTLETNPYE